LKNRFGIPFLVILFLLIPSGIAFFLPVPRTVATVLIVLFGCLSISWPIFNVIATRRMDKELESLSAEAIKSKFEEAREDILTHTEENKRNLQALLNRYRLITILLLVFAFLFTLGVDFFLMALMKPVTGNSAIAVCAIVNVIPLFLFGAMPLAALTNNTLPNRTNPVCPDAIPEKQFPLLYDVARRAANAVGYRGPFNLCRKYDMSGISVSEENGLVSVYLPPEDVCILTQTELYQILLHEFMHAVNTDTAFLTEIELAKWKYTSHSRWNKLYFSYFLERIEYESSLYLTYASRLHEAKADEAIGRYGDAQTYINATAKTMLLDKMIFALPRKELQYDFFENETVPNDYYERVVAIFERELPAVLEEEKAILFRTLPTKSDSHPTFRMRADLLGVTDFDPFEREPQNPYRAEVTTYCRACSSAYAELNRPKWKELRQESYLDVKERISVFESKGDDADEGERKEVIWDYLTVDRDKALALADTMLLQDGDNAVANYIKGFILCGKNRDGVAYLDKAIRKTINCLQPAGDMIARYVFSTGDEALVSTFRETQTEYAQLALDVVKRRRYYAPKPQQFLPCKLSEERLNTIKQVVTRIGKDSILHVSAVNASIGTGGDQVYVFIALLPPQPNESVMRAVNQLEAYLNSLETNDKAVIFWHTNKKDSPYFTKAIEIGTKLL